MRKTLKGLLIVLVIAIIGVLAWTGKIYLNEKKEQDTVANNQTQNNGSSNEKKVEEEKKEEDIKEEIAVEEPIDDENKEDEKENEETNSTNEEKAIELAKKEYGVTDGEIYYRIDQIQSNTEYIVSVRNKDTSVLAWYIVDVKAGTVKDY